MLSAFSCAPTLDETEVQTEKKRFSFRKSSKVSSNNDMESNPESRDATEVKEKSAGLFKASKIQKKVVYTQFSDDPKAVIQLVSEDGIPEPASGDDVVVKVQVSCKSLRTNLDRKGFRLSHVSFQASTVSYNDCLFRRGMSFSVVEPISIPATPGMDIIGNVVAVGKNVTAWKEGDRVAALVQTGGNARYAVISSNSLIAVPRSLDNSEAVCMVSIYMTAYQSLRLVVGKERTLKGKQVLIVGALGPVGQALIQMAKRAGADSVFATAPTNMHRYVKSVLGAKPLPMEPSEWLASIKGKMDVVMDNVCQDGFESSRAALSDKGALVCVGMSGLMNSETMGVFGAPMSARWAQTKASYFMSRTQTYDILDSFYKDPKKFKTDLEHVFQLLRQRDIKPHIAKRVCLSEVGEAHVYLELGKSRGAIVCMPWKRRILTPGVKAGKYGIDETELEDDRE